MGLSKNTKVCNFLLYYILVSVNLFLDLSVVGSSFRLSFDSVIERMFKLGRKM